MSLSPALSTLTASRVMRMVAVASAARAPSAAAPAAMDSISLSPAFRATGPAPVAAASVARPPRFPAVEVAVATERQAVQVVGRQWPAKPAHALVQSQSCRWSADQAGVAVALE